jgi:hypothetical protein
VFRAPAMHDHHPGGHYGAETRSSPS